MPSAHPCEYSSDCVRAAFCGLGIIDAATDGYRLLVLACQDCVWDLHTHTEHQYRRMSIAGLLRLRNAPARQQDLGAVRGT